MITDQRIREICAQVDAEEAEKALKPKSDQTALLESEQAQWGKWFPRSLEPTPTTPGFISE